MFNFIVNYRSSIKNTVDWVVKGIKKSIEIKERSRGSEGIKENGLPKKRNQIKLKKRKNKL